MLPMKKLFFIIALLASVSARWTCNPKPREETPNSRTAPLNVVKVYKCTPPEYELYEALAAPPYNQQELPEAFYGVKLSYNNEQIQVNATELRKELGRIGLGYKEVPSIYGGENKKKEVKVVAPGSLFVQAKTSCSDLTGLYGGVDVWSEAIEIQLPPLGNCVPTDYFLPLNGAALTSNPADIKLQIEGRLELTLNIKVGLHWDMSSLNGLTPSMQRSLLDGLIRADSLPDGTNLDLYRLTVERLDSLLNTFPARFNSIKNSKTTGLTWTDKNSPYQINRVANIKDSFTISAERNVSSLDYTYNNDYNDAKYWVDPGTAARHYQLVAKCGPYTLYTLQVLKRVYALNGTCIGWDAHDNKQLKKHGPNKPEGIEDCRWCAGLECAGPELCTCSQ